MDPELVVDGETGEILPAKQLDPAPVQLRSNLPVQISQELADLMFLAEALLKSGYFQDTKTVSQGVAKIWAGRALGLSDWASLQGFDWIPTQNGGSLAPRSKVLASLVRRSRKYDYKVKKLTDDGCEIEFYKDGQLEGVSSYTMADARKAGLINDKRPTYQKVPRNMLFARAMGNGVSWYAPDLITMGSSDYSADVDDIIDADIEE